MATVQNNIPIYLMKLTAPEQTYLEQMHLKRKLPIFGRSHFIRERFLKNIPLVNTIGKSIPLVNAIGKRIPLVNTIG